MRKILLAVIAVLMMAGVVGADPVPGAQPRTIDGMSGGTITGSDSRITFGEGSGVYVDGNDANKGITLYPRLANFDLRRQFAVDMANVPVANGTPVFAWTPFTFATDTTDVIGNDVTHSAAVASTEVIAGGNVWKINVTSGQLEYVCTGTASTCAYNSNLFFDDANNIGFIAMYVGEFVRDATYGQTLMGVWDADGSPDRNWRIAHANTGASQNTIGISLRDEAEGTAATCTLTTTSTVTEGASGSVIVIYDGFGTSAADSHMRIYIDGVDVTPAAAGCANYDFMQNATTTAFEIGNVYDATSPSATTNIDGDIVGAFVWKLTSPANLASAPTTYDETARMLHIIAKQYAGLP